MEKDREQKHWCKLCRKCFPCGRSLGGHMRSHAAVVSSSDSDERRPESKSHRSTTGFGAGYGLRENPKKTSRQFDFGGTPPSGGEKECKVCGKGFPKLKALFGHMRCHSAKNSRSSKEEENQEQEQEQERGEQGGTGSQSDDEVVAAMVPRKKPRSRRMPPAAPALFSPANEYEPEVVDAAVTLMMLSGDVGHWSPLHSVGEPFDTSSVVLESKGMGGEGEGGFASELGASGIGYRRNGINKIESDVSDNGLVGDSEFKKPEVNGLNKIDSSDEESNKGASKKRNLDCRLAELGKKTGLGQSDSQVGKLASSKRERFDGCDSKSGGGSCDARQVLDARYECTTCNKSFHSYQALGGHRAGHKRFKCGSKSLISPDENIVETDASIEQAAVEGVIDHSSGADAGHGSSKKIKGHECMTCGKVFPSGQALGGHKRSHYVPSSDGGGDAACPPIAVQPQPTEVPDLLDLNLPAPADGGSISTNTNLAFKSWWAASNLNPELLVGMISN